MDIRNTKIYFGNDTALGEQIYSPSSRSNEKTNWNTISIPEYFKQLTK